MHYSPLLLVAPREGESTPRAPLRPRKMLKKPSVFKYFQKKWCWRSSFEVARFKICRILELICLFLLQNALGSLGTPLGPAWVLLAPPWDSLGTPWDSLGLPWDALGLAWDRLGPIWDPLGIILGSFEIILESCGDHFGIIWESF